MRYNLNGAILDDAILDEIDFSNANLKAASIRNVKMDRAIFIESNLEKAKFNGSYFYYPNFKNANLKECDFSYSRNILRENGKSVGGSIHRTFMVRADFTDAILQNSDFSGAVFTGSDFTGANLEGVKFFNYDESELHLEATKHGADLTGTKGLTISQLKTVTTLYNVKLDENLLDQVKRECPEKLDNPKK